MENKVAINENNEAETQARKDVEQLKFVHKRFNPQDIMEFVKLHGNQAALAIMQECVERNDARRKKGLQPESEGSRFKQKARHYKGRTAQEQKANEWEAHVQAIKAADEDAAYERLKGLMDNSLDEGYISTEQYEKGVAFLGAVEQEKRIKSMEVVKEAAPGRLLCWNAETLRMECGNCREPVESMKLHASVAIGLTWADADDGKEIFGCDEWEYAHIYLKCVCGIIMSTDDVKGFTGQDFSFENPDENWEVHIPKEGHDE